MLYTFGWSDNLVSYCSTLDTRRSTVMCNYSRVYKMADRGPNPRPSDSPVWTAAMPLINLGILSLGSPAWPPLSSSQSAGVGGAAYWNKGRESFHMNEPVITCLLM